MIPYNVEMRKLEQLIKFLNIMKNQSPLFTNNLTKTNN